jgi:hypothetical protein
MPKKEFTSKLERFEGSGTWTYADIPFDVERAFGKKGQVKVKGTVNGVGFLSSLMPHGDGTHFLVVNRSTRDAAKIKEGAKVRIVIEADSEPRLIQAPPDLERALAKNKSAAASWEKLAPSHKKEYVLWITEAKKEETRQRRIEKAVAKIAEDGPLKQNLGPGRN